MLKNMRKRELTAQAFQEATDTLQREASRHATAALHQPTRDVGLEMFSVRLAYDTGRMLDA